MKRNPKPEILQNLKIFECFHKAKKKVFFQILENILILDFSNTRGLIAQVYV